MSDVVPLSLNPDRKGPAPVGLPNSPPQPRLRPIKPDCAVPPCWTNSSPRTTGTLVGYVGGTGPEATSTPIARVGGVHGRNATDPALLVALWMYATSMVSPAHLSLDEL